ncbi:hypothetical protein LWI28_012122 [Acer negundo]|uniref:J domain-containing protein n=1 Tax=Acer negundo TaxID=4023 RepID=A0AAD5NPZ5_ACENE|nr:hypothetical protein LWI28_012122 [Acer negundo]
MGLASKAGDLVFKGFTAGLGLATIYLTATFSFNVYKGLSWHNAQSKLEESESDSSTISCYHSHSRHSSFFHIRSAFLDLEALLTASSTTSCYHSHSLFYSPITMTEVILDMAEALLERQNCLCFQVGFSRPGIGSQFWIGKSYVEAYRINLTALMKHPIGERNWYKLLGIEQHSISCQAITHKFVKLAKMIDPEVHSSAAAPTALKHITMAWGNLGEPDKRCAYHARVGLPPPVLEKPLEIASKKRSRLETQMEIASQKRCSSSHSRENTSQKRCQVNSNSHPSEIASQKRSSSSHQQENTSQKRCQVNSSSHPSEIASQKRCSSSHSRENTSQKRCQVNSNSHPSEIASQKRSSSSHQPENTSQKRCQVNSSSHPSEIASQKRCSSSHPPENASQKRCRIKSSSHHVNSHRVIF